MRAADDPKPDPKMSEEDPLLPIGNVSGAVNHLESQSTLPETRYQRAKARTADFLESDPLHYIVITLVRTFLPCH